MGRKHTARGPLRATKFFFTLAMASSGMTVFPSFKVGVTSTGSHLIGAYLDLSLLYLRRSGALPSVTFAAAKMSLTDCAISGPMPSPSINVTVYFP